MPATIVQAGSINTAALVTPQAIVQINPPPQLINGVQTNIVGVVGTASWGPVNVATIVATLSDYARQFGSVQARKYDAGTAVATANQQGAANFRVVRVTDGTDTAASGVLVANCLNLTSLYSGSFGNLIQASISGGSKAATWRIIISAPGQLQETFDNLSGTGNAFWVAAAAAINSGNNTLRGKSQLVVASVGSGTTAPAVVAATPLSGGTDGTGTITAATLVGVDIGSRTGMYALRRQACSIGLLADADDGTQWTTIDGFGLTEGIYMMQVLPNGTSVAAAVTAKQTSGLDSYASKLLHGDYVYWSDATNAQIRMVSPQGFAAGRLASLGPQQSSLNKQLYGVIGTQRSGSPGSAQVQTYSQAETDVLFGTGIDCMLNPCPGGYYWGFGGGRNASSDASRHGDNYTRMTNFVAATIASAIGKFVGRLQTPTERLEAKGTLDAFLDALWTQGMIGTADGLTIPYRTVLDNSNNPSTRVALGYQVADIQVTYLSIIEFFIVNLTGGQSVVVSRLSTQPNA